LFRIYSVSREFGPPTGLQGASHGQRGQARRHLGGARGRPRGRSAVQMAATFTPSVWGNRKCPFSADAHIVTVVELCALAPESSWKDPFHIRLPASREARAGAGPTRVGRVAGGRVVIAPPACANWAACNAARTARSARWRRSRT
jgi:hypothetical protein